MASVGGYALQREAWCDRELHSQALYDVFLQFKEVSRQINACNSKNAGSSL